LSLSSLSSRSVGEDSSSDDGSRWGVSASFSSMAGPKRLKKGSSTMETKESRSPPLVRDGSRPPADEAVLELAVRSVEVDVREKTLAVALLWAESRAADAEGREEVVVVAPEGRLWGLGPSEIL